jgi:cytochrome P450
VTPAGDLRASQPRFDPRRRDFQIDPYPVYAAFRTSEPVHYSPLYQGWFVFRYDDVVSVCDDNDRFSAAALDSTDPRGLFTLDDPEHAQVRALVEGVWCQTAAETPRLAERSIEQTLGALAGREDFDLVDDFARLVPRNVYFDLLGGAGIGAAERAVIDTLARTVMKHHDHLLDEMQRYPGEEAKVKLLQQLGPMLLEAGGSSSRFQGSFLAHLAPVIGDRHPLNLQVALVTLINLTVAGYMSVEFLLATGIRRLLLDRENLWEKVAQPAFLPKALEEMRRTAHALSVVDRFARRDLTIAGVPIPKGARVFGVLASANRDECVFGASAERFDPDRAWPQPHLGLGHGVHDCMGRHFEPLISAPAIAALYAAMPGLRLQSSAEPPWFRNFYFRSFDHLGVTTR